MSLTCRKFIACDKVVPCKSALRPIYAVQLCRMRCTHDRSTTRVVSCKSNLQLACDCRVRHEECRGLLKHVLKPYDNRSDRQFDIVEVVYDFSITRVARALKIACDNRKQKSYRVNRPLRRLERVFGCTRARLALVIQNCTRQMVFL